MAVFHLDLSNPSQKRAAAELEAAGLKLGTLGQTDGMVDLDDAHLEVTRTDGAAQPSITEVIANIGPKALRGLVSLSDRTKPLLDNFPDGTTIHVRHRTDGVGTRVTIGGVEAKDYPLVVGNGSSGILGNKEQPGMDIEVTGQESFLAGRKIVELANPELLSDAASFAVSMAQHATETRRSLPQ